MLMTKSPTRLIFLGGGKISEALLSGLHNTKGNSNIHVDESGPGLAPSQIPSIAGNHVQTGYKHIAVVDLSSERCTHLKRRFNHPGLDVYDDLSKVPPLFPTSSNSDPRFSASIGDSSVLVLAVKPKDAVHAFKSIKKWRSSTGASVAKNDKYKDNMLLLSVIAGLPIQKIKDLSEVKSVVRSMPNTPAAIGAGVTMWCASEECTPDNLAHAKNLLSTVGKEIFTNDEDMLDMATAVSGSGPAYVYLVQESMIDAAVHMGLPRSIATDLVMETLRGSVEYSIKSGKHAAVLREEITSPGGTTISALYHAEKGGLRTVLSDAMWAAYKRAKELSSAAKSVPQKN